MTHQPQQQSTDHLDRPSIELCVFDMAGTTIDDGGEVYQALRHAVEQTGATVDAADLQTWMGADKVQAITELMRLGGQEPGRQRVAAAFDEFRSFLTESYRQDPPRPLDGVEQTFATLREHGIRIQSHARGRDVVQPPAQLVVVVHARPSRSRIPRSLCSASDRYRLTAPDEMPSSAATWSTVRSSS